MFALLLQAVGCLQQASAIIKHQLADLGQMTLIGTSFKKFDAKLNFQRRDGGADGAAAFAEATGGVGNRAAIGGLYKEFYLI